MNSDKSLEDDKELEELLNRVKRELDSFQEEYEREHVPPHKIIDHVAGICELPPEEMSHLELCTQCSKRSEELASLLVKDPDDDLVREDTTTAQQLSGESSGRSTMNSSSRSRQWPNIHSWLRKVALIATAALVVFGLLLRTGAGSVEFELTDPQITVTINGRKIDFPPDGKAAIVLEIGDHRLEIRTKDGRQYSEIVTILRRGQRLRKTLVAPPPGIYGTVFNDVNGNGVWEELDEPSLQGWRIYLDENRNGIHEDTEPVQTTTRSGYFHFPDLPPGSYLLAQLPPTGWEQTYPTKNVFQSDFPVIIQENMNRGGTATTYDIEFPFDSFRIEYDINVSSIEYGSGINFGLYNQDLNTQERSNYVHVIFAMGDPGNTFHLDCKNARGTSYTDHAGARQFDCDRWYHVLLEFDSAQQQVKADITDRDSGEHIASLSCANVESFGPNMTKLGSSNIRRGTFQVPGAKAQAKIQNAILSVSSLRPHKVKLDSFQATRRVRLGNRRLGDVRGVLRTER